MTTDLFIHQPLNMLNLTYHISNKSANHPNTRHYNTRIIIHQ